MRKIGAVIINLEAKDGELIKRGTVRREVSREMRSLGSQIFSFRVIEGETNGEETGSEIVNRCLNEGGNRRDSHR